MFYSSLNQHCVWCRFSRTNIKHSIFIRDSIFMQICLNKWYIAFSRPIVILDIKWEYKYNIYLHSTVQTSYIWWQNYEFIPWEYCSLKSARSRIDQTIKITFFYELFSYQIELKWICMLNATTSRCHCVFWKRWMVNKWL